jgi:hypothetical protein
MPKPLVLWPTLGPKAAAWSQCKATHKPGRAAFVLLPVHGTPALETALLRKQAQDGTVGWQKPVAETSSSSLLFSGR